MLNPILCAVLVKPFTLATGSLDQTTDILQALLRSGYHGAAVGTPF